MNKNNDTKREIATRIDDAVEKKSMLFTFAISAIENPVTILMTKEKIMRKAITFNEDTLRNLGIRFD